MTLQEYLIKLGWSVDEPSMKKFVSAISATGARTAEFGSIAIETAAAVELMVSRVARNYESLYYMSQRSGQSVKFIQQTQFGFKQIGLSAEDANASIEGIAATLRTQPWLRSLFGDAKTPQDIASRLGRSGLPYFLQVKFAEMIGMSEKTLFQLQRFGNVEAAAQAEFARKQREAGLDPDDLAKKSANFGRSLNSLEATLEIFGDRMAADLIGPTEKGVKILDQVVQTLNRVNKATNGWASTLVALGGTAGGLLVLEKVLRRLLGLGGKSATGTILTGGKRFLGGGLLKGLGTTALYGGLYEGLKTVKENDPETKKNLREMLGPLLYELGLSKSPNLNDENPPEAAGSQIGPQKRSRATTSQKERAQQAIDMLVAAGYPLESAKGIVGGLYGESQLDPKSILRDAGGTAEGIGQWRGSRQRDFEKMFNKPIRDASFEEQLQFVIHELQNGDPQSRQAGAALRGGGLNSTQAASAFINGFERPGATGAYGDLQRAVPFMRGLSDLLPQQDSNAGAESGGKQVVLNANTTVNVNANSSDAQATSQAYKKAAGDVNNTLVRNLSPATR